MSLRRVRRSLVILLMLSLLADCRPVTVPTVVVYTSVDQPHSEPVLQAFEQATGIRVRAVYDTEATKTTGLVSRLMAERDRPQADVFWSSEIAQTLWLQEQGVLTPYLSPQAADIPLALRDPNGYWTGMGLRARILLVNTDLVPASAHPRSIFDLIQWSPGEAGVANPLFGTTATHIAALYAALGADEARAYVQALRDGGARVVDGNSVVRDMVVSGDLQVGLTDTDDAHSATQAGKPVKVIVPDQDGIGALLIPNTIALVAGGPNSEQGHALVDFLVSQDTEQMLTEVGFLYASVRSQDLDPTLVGMDVSWPEVAVQMAPAKRDVKEILLR